METLIKETNKELVNAAIWFQVNQLALNVLKTEYRIFRNKNIPIKENQCKITIGNEDLELLGDDCKTKFSIIVGLKLNEHLT